MKDETTEPGIEGEDAATAAETEAPEDGALEGEAQDEVDAELAAPTDLEAELAAAQDAALRAQADAVNMQRRAEQEIEKARKFALERICGDLLSVVDNLERALESAGDSEGSASLLEGVELTRKGFMDVLVKYGVQVVDPMGEPFDPETAQAMSLVEQPDAEPNSVIAVMQKGYTLNGRLLRPAMVMVSKAPSQ
ncbi:MAG: nucleotide exchange factor GrpE [Luminiphilus sp.]|jgi:molecular chaperone GrpE